MAKNRTIYFCRNCGAQSATWVGRCHPCGEWNTFEEEVLPSENHPANRSGAQQVKSRPVHLSEIAPSTGSRRILTGIQEINRVLGGGIVPGSVILLGGEPGIGKSTLLLQLALSLPEKRKVLYVSGEESEMQLKMRARITCNPVSRAPRC